MPLRCLPLAAIALAGCASSGPHVNAENEPFAREALVSAEGLAAYIEATTDDEVVSTRYVAVPDERDSSVPRVAGFTALTLAAGGTCNVVSHGSAEEARRAGPGYCQNVRRANGVAWSGEYGQRWDERDSFREQFYPRSTAEYLSGCYTFGTQSAVCWSNQNSASQLDVALRALVTYDDPSRMAEGPLCERPLRPEAPRPEDARAEWSGGAAGTDGIPVEPTATASVS